MAYLDKILENLHKLGLSSQQEIKQYFASRDDINDKVKEVLFNLGYKNTAPTPEHQALYLKWTNSWQMDHEVVLVACRQAVRKRSRSHINQVDGILTRWKERRLLLNLRILKLSETEEDLLDEIKTVLERRG